MNIGQQIEIFDAKKSDLTILVESYKDLQIIGINDMGGYERVHRAMMTLVKERTALSEQRKAITIQLDKAKKLLMDKEKDLLSISVPCEEKLRAKKKVINDAIEIEKRKASIPERIRRLVEVGITQQAAEHHGGLHLMDDKTFEAFLLEQQTIILEEKRKDNEKKQRELDAGIAKLKEDKILENIAKQARIETEDRARLEIEQAKQRAEDDKQKAISDIQAKADADKQKLIDDQKIKDDERIEAERKKKEAEDDEKRYEAERYRQAEASRVRNEDREKAKSDKLRKDQKLQDWLKGHGYNEQEFGLKQNGNRFILWKKIGEIII